MNEFLKILVVGLFFLTMSNAFATVQSGGLVNHWKLDEGSGTTAGDSSGNNTGTLMNNPAWTTGKLGFALSFDGVDDYVDFGNAASLNITGPITVEAWVNRNPSQIDDNGDIVQKGCAYQLKILRNGYIRMNFHNGTEWVDILSNNPIAANEWTHIVVTRTIISGNSLLKFYINGILDKEQTATGIPISSSEAVTIGAFNSTTERFNGIIDEVRLWNRALSPAEILTYSVVYWKLSKKTVVVETNSAALVELPSGIREETYTLKPGNNEIHLAQIRGSSIVERVAFEGEGVMPFCSVQGQIDWTDSETIVHSLVRKDATDREKAFALYRFALGRFANLSMHNQVDITRFFHSLGYGFCSTQAMAFQCLLDIAGIQWRMPDLPGHGTTEVYFDNAWHNLDPYVRCYFLKRDGETIASCADIKADPELLLRHVDADGRFPWLMIPPEKVGSGLWFNYKGPGAKGNIPWTKETFCLRRGEKITFLQERKGYWCHAISEPPDYANGLLEAKLVADDKDWRNQFIQVENITTQRLSSGIAVLTPEDLHKNASLIYQCISPFLLATGEVVLHTSAENSTSAVSVEIQSPVTGQEWRRVPLDYEQNEVKADLKPFLSCQSVPYGGDPAPGKTMVFNYRLRIGIDVRDKTGKNPAGICAITIRHLFQYFPSIIPECVQPADVLLVKGCKGTGTMMLTLREQAGLRVSKEQPFENEEVQLTALVHNRGTQLAHNVVVRFYDGDPDRGGIGICNDVVLGEIAPGKSAEAKSIWQAWLRPTYPGHGWPAGYFRVFGNYAALVTSDSPDFPPSTALCPSRTYKDTWLYARITCADVDTRLLNSQTRFRVRVQQRPSLVITPDYVVVAVEESAGAPVISARATVRYIPQSTLFMYQQHNSVRNISVSFILVQCEGNREIAQQKQEIAQIFPSEHATVAARFEGVRLTKGKYMLRAVVNPNENILSRSGLTAQKEFIY